MMEDTMDHDFDCDCESCIGDEETDVEYEPIPELTPRDKFTQLVQQILSLSQGAPEVYQRLHDTVVSFDRELAAKLQACKAADEALISYCQKKVEGR